MGQNLRFTIQDVIRNMHILTERDTTLPSLHRVHDILATLDSNGVSYSFQQLMLFLGPDNGLHG